MKAKKLKLRVYSIISDAIERGIRYGFNRAYKHSDNHPSEQEIAACVDHVHLAIMNEISDVINFDDN